MRTIILLIIILSLSACGDYATYGIPNSVFNAGHDNCTQVNSSLDRMYFNSNNRFDIWRDDPNDDSDNDYKVHIQRFDVIAKCVNGARFNFIIDVDAYTEDSVSSTQPPLVVSDGVY